MKAPETIGRVYTGGTLSTNAMIWCVLISLRKNKYNGASPVKMPLHERPRCERMVSNCFQKAEPGKVRLDKKGADENKIVKATYAKQWYDFCPNRLFVELEECFPVDETKEHILKNHSPLQGNKPK